MSIIFKMLKYLKNYSNQVKNVTIVALIIILAIHIFYLTDYKSMYTNEVESNLSMQMELDSVKKLNNELTKQVKDQEQELTEYIDKIELLENSIEDLKKENIKYNKYKQASTVWLYLKSVGLNDYVCAGILGNIMAEVGGQTLDISRWSQYSSDSDGYYGICQWSSGRKQRLLNNFGSSLEAQLNFLSVELFEVIPKDSSFYILQNIMRDVGQVHMV